MTSGPCGLAVERVPRARGARAWGSRHIAFATGSVTLPLAHVLAARS